VLLNNPLPAHCQPANVAGKSNHRIGGVTMTGINATIVVSNIKSFEGKPYIASPKFMVRFPRCRKIKQASEMFIYDKVYLKSLWDYNGSITLTAEEYNKILWDAPIVPDRNFPVEITQEMRNEIRENIVYEGKPYTA
jgi:hypothetical protein